LLIHKGLFRRRLDSGAALPLQSIPFPSFVRAAVQVAGSPHGPHYRRRLLVMMASKRARQLANGVQATIDNSESEDKPTVLALREIAARKIDNELIEEVEKAERERVEREALEWAAAEVVADEDMSKNDD